MELSELIAALEQIDAQADRPDSAARLLELVRSGAPLNEITVFGNREGFIYLGLLCLDLANNERRGAHFQFDQTSLFSRIDVNLVLARSIDDHSERNEEKA